MNQEFKKLKGEIEIDEAYFSGGRKGNRGRGAAEKIIVLGILERNNWIYTILFPILSQKLYSRRFRKKPKKKTSLY